MKAQSAESAVRADAWKRFWRNRLAVVGLVIVAGLLVAALLAPVLAPHDPGLQDLAAKRTAPGARFLLGADEFGRDILSRIIFGTRVALLVGTVSVGIALGLGLFLGILSGYVGGVVDSLISRTLEILLAFPYLLLAIAVGGHMGMPNLMSMIPGVDAGASMMMKDMMKKKGVASFEELRSLALESDVRMIACQMTMDLFEYTLDDMIPGIEVGGAATYIEVATQSDINLFI